MNQVVRMRPQTKEPVAITQLQEIEVPCVLDHRYDPELVHALAVIAHENKLTFNLAGRYL